jgi:3-keto-5-aminohexanoate cleavage enzyme
MQHEHGLIINLCPTGMVPDKKMTPHVPVTAQEIIADVCQCAERGANLIHLHARDEKGVPHYSRDIYARQIAGIREKYPHLPLCVSLSGRNYGEFSQRSDSLNLAGDLRPDMGSLTLSSLNFSGQASINSPEMVRRLAETMGEKGIKPELEVFDLGMMSYAHYLISKGALQPPYYFNILFGNIATAQAKPIQLAALISEMPESSVWCLAGIGKQQLKSCILGLMYGDGARIGIEDNIWYDDKRTRLATNAEFVERIRDVARLIERRIATPEEVRARLNITPLCA